MEKFLPYQGGGVGTKILDLYEYYKDFREFLAYHHPILEKWYFSTHVF